MRVELKGTTGLGKGWMAAAGMPARASIGAIAACIASTGGDDCG